MIEIIRVSLGISRNNNLRWDAGLLSLLFEFAGELFGNLSQLSSHSISFVGRLLQYFSKILLCCSAIFFEFVLQLIVGFQFLEQLAVPFFYFIDVTDKLFQFVALLIAEALAFL